ncbi:HAD family hydrolase [Gordonia sp. zg691]|uniref:HAD family hydrolase n=1 Tax=Gordonia jinghuaiqii TaxID=2758710 RepID=A0A7D7LTN2_9ACTN|nr:HAD family hydrolase [Gordonia jinghuaiqii]MBD0862175.1 HAD family hydrolase [Gordonia jinghuaiqii]MCR5978601.1 HAD-IA family hydrolase [Gordonia jinghuaiqii]QMT02920.1 HAD family hydrolase [Gordonia jinghuaiqii]
MPDQNTTETIDTVLLDVDGTLIDSTYLHALAWMRAFAAHDLTPLWWRVHRAIGMGGDRLVGEICGDEVEESLGDTLRDAWSEHYRGMLADVRPLPGAVDLIRGLLDADYRVALASSGKSEFTDAALDSMGLHRDDFAAVTTSDDADSSKPAPDILSVALERAGGGRAVVVGDTVWDIESAHRLPADCVAVRSGGFAEGELRDAGAILVVDDVGDLVARGWRP